MWYPFYGSSLIAVVSEALILLLKPTKESGYSIFIVLYLLVQACRLLLFIALPIVILSRRLERSISSDEEASPLLGQDKKSTRKRGSPVYGTLSAAPSKSDEESEDEDSKRNDKDREKLEKHLQDSGSVFK